MKKELVKTLETERLILRELREEDANDAFKNWTSDDDVSKYVRWTTHKNVDETLQYIKEDIRKCKEEEYFTWFIKLKEKNELIGAIAAFISEDNRYELGYNISKKYWNNGYTTEALKRVLDYLINEKNIHRFRCAHDVQNPASGAVMRKAGFEYVKDSVYEKYDGSSRHICKVYYLDV